MRYTTRFGKIIDISLETYLNMSDDDLLHLEEREGTFSGKQERPEDKDPLEEDDNLPIIIPLE